MFAPSLDPISLRASKPIQTYSKFEPIQPDSNFKQPGDADLEIHVTGQRSTSPPAATAAAAAAALANGGDAAAASLANGAGGSMTQAQALTQALTPSAASRRGSSKGGAGGKGGKGGAKETRQVVRLPLALLEHLRDRARAWAASEAAAMESADGDANASGGAAADDDGHPGDAIVASGDDDGGEDGGSEGEGGSGSEKQRRRPPPPPLSWRRLPKVVFVCDLVRRACAQGGERLVFFSERLDVLNLLETMLLVRDRTGPGGGVALSPWAKGGGGRGAEEERLDVLNLLETMLLVRGGVDAITEYSLNVLSL